MGKWRFCKLSMYDLGSWNYESKSIYIILNSIARCLFFDIFVVFGSDITVTWYYYVIQICGFIFFHCNCNIWPVDYNWFICEDGIIQVYFVCSVFYCMLCCVFIIQWDNFLFFLFCFSLSPTKTNVCLMRKKWREVQPADSGLELQTGMWGKKIDRQTIP